MTPSRFLSVAEFACKTARSLIVGKGAPTLPGPLGDGDWLADKEAEEEVAEPWAPPGGNSQTLIWASPLSATFNDEPVRPPVVLPAEFDTDNGLAALLRHHGLSVEFAERAVEAKAAKTEKLSAAFNDDAECRIVQASAAGVFDCQCRDCLAIIAAIPPLEDDPVAKRLGLVPQSPAAGAGPVAPEEARPEPASSGVPEAICDVLADHRASEWSFPEMHRRGVQCLHANGELCVDLYSMEGWRKHVASLIAAALDGGAL